MKKRAQITIFIILGMVILFSFLSFLIISDKSNVQKEEEIDETDFQEYFNFFESCLRKEAEAAIFELPLSGGYYNSPPYSEKIIIFDYPYYLYYGKNYFPEKTTVENELSKLFAEFSNGCYADLNDVLPKGYLVEQGEIKVGSIMKEGSVLLNITSPLTIGNMARKRSVSNYIIEIDTDINQIYNAISEFMLSQENNMEGLCWTCLSDAADKYNLTVDTEIYDEHIVIFSFVKESNDSNLSWIFLNRY